MSLSQLLATHSMIQNPDPVSHSVSMHQGEIRGTTGARGGALCAGGQCWLVYANNPCRAGTLNRVGRGGLVGEPTCT